MLFEPNLLHDANCAIRGVRCAVRVNTLANVGPWAWAIFCLPTPDTQVGINYPLPALTLLDPPSKLVRWSNDLYFSGKSGQHLSSYTATSFSPARFTLLFFIIHFCVIFQFFTCEPLVCKVTQRAEKYLSETFTQPSLYVTVLLISAGWWDPGIRIFCENDISLLKAKNWINAQLQVFCQLKQEFNVLLEP